MHVAVDALGANLVALALLQGSKINLQCHGTNHGLQTTNLASCTTRDIEESILALLAHITIYVRTARTLARLRIALQMIFDL